MELESLRDLIRDVPDFPSKGIIFRDLTTMLKNGEALRVMSKELAALYRDKGILFGSDHYKPHVDYISDKKIRLN